MWRKITIILSFSVICFARVRFETSVLENHWVIRKCTHILFCLKLCTEHKLHCFTSCAEFRVVILRRTVGTCELSNKRDCEVCCSCYCLLWCNVEEFVWSRRDKRQSRTWNLGPSATESLIVSWCRQIWGFHTQMRSLRLTAVTIVVKLINRGSEWKRVLEHWKFDHKRGNPRRFSH